MEYEWQIIVNRDKYVYIYIMVLALDCINGSQTIDFA